MFLAQAASALLASGEPGEESIRWTIRVALVFYGLAMILILSPDRSARLARWFWSLALGVYLVHVLLAFHYYHHWSHADAFARTERVAGFGPGIYISHLFSLLWTLDVVWWWLAPQSHDRRGPWLTGLLHGFLAFIIFNGAVVFAAGPVRWSSLALFLLLAGLLLDRLLRQREKTLGPYPYLRGESQHR